MMYTFKIQIKHIKKPPVWRRLRVPAHVSFYQFHEIIQEVFGWYDMHLFSFSPQGFGSASWISATDDLVEEENPDFVDATTVRLSKVFEEEGQKYVYIYDFGDNWEHIITLEEIDKHNISPFPELLAGKGAVPFEDCGGPSFYEGYKVILTDKNHPDHKEVTNMLLPGWYSSDDDDNKGIKEYEDDAWSPNLYEFEEEKEMFDELFRKLIDRE